MEVTSYLCFTPHLIHDQIHRWLKDTDVVEVGGFRAPEGPELVVGGGLNTGNTEVRAPSSGWNLQHNVRGSGAGKIKLENVT